MPVFIQDYYLVPVMVSHVAIGQPCWILVKTDVWHLTTLAEDKMMDFVECSDLYEKKKFNG
jgi:hypothetical protein